MKELSFFRTTSPSSVRSNLDSLRQLHNKTKARVKDNLPSSIYGLLVLEGVEAAATAAVAEAVAVVVVIVAEVVRSVVVALPETFDIAV